MTFFKSFSNTYATFLTAGIMGPFIFFVVGNTKILLWGILTTCLPITIDVTLGHTGHISGSAGYIIAVFDMVLVVLYFLWIVEMVKDKRIEIRFFPKISVPTLLLIGISTVSMAFSGLPELCKFELVEMVKIFLAFFYVANNIKNEQELRYIVGVLVAGLFFEGVIGFGQHRYSDPIWPSILGGPNYIDNRVSGTWVSFNEFAWYLTFILPLALSLLFSKIQLMYKYACGLAFMIGSGSLMWTNSRGGWISFAVSGIFVIVFCFGKIKGRWGLVKTVVSIMTITVLISPIYPRLSAKIYGRFSANDGGSADSRLPQFEVAYNIIKDKPFTGVGLNNYTEVMSYYDTTDEGLEEITPHAVHNIFLHMTAEIGIFGFAAFMWVLVAILHEGIRMGAESDDFLSYVNVGLVGGIMAFLCHGFVDSASLGSKMFYFLWFLSGIIYSSIYIINKSNMIDPHQANLS